MAYDAFLTDLVSFLVSRPTEIIVVQLRWDGVPNECARPSDQEQREYLDAALKPTNGSLLAGNLDDLRNKSIGQLVVVPASSTLYTIAFGIFAAVA